MNLSKIKFNKKADMDVSLSWIFMIIIGGVFLLLAYNIVSKYQENENGKYEIELKQSLRTQLNLAGRNTGVEENSLQNVENLFQGKSAEVKCMADKPTLWLDDGKIVDTKNQFLNNYPVFMTKISESKTDDVYIGVESFRMPFKITNMLFLNSKKNLIVMDKDSAITKKLLYKFNKGSYKNLNFKANENFDLAGLTQIKNEANKKNLDSIVLVYSTDRDEITPSSICTDDFHGVDLYLIQIDEKNKGKYGTITYKCGSSFTGEKTFNYIDDDDSLGLVTMALFSNPDTFNCSYNQVIKSINPVYNFYIQKTTYLSVIGNNSQICSASILTNSGNLFFVQQVRYDNLKISLEKIQTEVKNNNFTNVDQINAKLTELEDKLEIIEDLSCPYVY